MRIALVALLLVLALPARAQQIEELGEAPPPEVPEDRPPVSLEAGLTLTSRFIYRGINLGEAPQVQPRLSLNVGDFQASLWGSHPLAQASDESVESPRDANYREVLLWMLYNIDVGVGTLTPYVQNHFNPNTGQLFDFADNGDGAHFFQAQLMFSGDDRLPVDALVGWVFYNDPGESVYFEGGYRFDLSGLNLRAFAGGVPGRSPFNGVPEDEVAITNIGLSAGRSIRLSDEFSIPVSVTFIANPYLEDAFAVFSISLM
ncbi:MAG: hypothetical protein AAGI52_11550 [Bacteroidota bacterium]